jgi:periplasmic divalent cation tolerance protein
VSDHIIIITTTDSEENAKALSGSLVRDRLVACAQRSRIDSTFEWEGKVQEEAEFLILLKTNKANQQAAMDAIQERHTYDEPEIIVVPIVDGSAGYLGWIDKVTN